MAAKKRGRKSAAAVESEATAPTKVAVLAERPAPPTELTEFQAETWRAIVACLPAEWFSLETLPLLAQYVRHVENAKKLAFAVDNITVELLATQLGRDTADQLMKMAEREGRAMSSLATRLRLTQQSRYNPARANTEAGKTGAGKKPWEFEGDK